MTSFMPLASERPAYVINKLSNVIERPDPSHPLYTAFHGPSANFSFINWINDIFGGNERHYIGDNLLSVWRPRTPLYLYHGKRRCVSKEDEDGNFAQLFDGNDDASLEKYSGLSFPTPESIEKNLMDIMGSTGLNQFPVNKIK